MIYDQLLESTIQWHDISFDKEPAFLLEADSYEELVKSIEEKFGEWTSIYNYGEKERYAPGIRFSICMQGYIAHVLKVVV